MPIRIEDYARALRDARQTGVKVTSVLLCNPHVSSAAPESANRTVN